MVYAFTHKTTAPLSFFGWLSNSILTLFAAVVFIFVHFSNLLIYSYKENKIDTITAYQYINSILGRYYYCVTMPKEDEEIRQKRKNKSGIEICNPDDPTERAIKENLEINQQFPNFRKMLETIGIENLDMYKSDKTLITKYEELQGGKQKEKTKKIINPRIAIAS